LETHNTSAVSAPELAARARESSKSSAISYVRELGLKPEHTKAVLVGASVAGALAHLAVTVAVARTRKRRRDVDEGSGVFGTIVKSALFAALRTVIKVKAVQLTAKTLHQEPNRTPLERPNG
jgi:hypothetical protein